MTARTHDVAAITALGLVVLNQPIRSFTVSTLLIALLANQLGGIAPDIDQPTAPFWRNLPIGHTFGKVFDKLLGGHRFITHSVLGVALFTGAFYGLLHFLHPIMPSVDIGLVCWAFFIGMLSHLIVDSFTKEGVPWLLPLPIKFGFPPIKSMRITTGKFAEKIALFALVAIDVIYGWSHYADLVSIFKNHLV